MFWEKTENLSVKFFTPPRAFSCCPFSTKTWGYSHTTTIKAKKLNQFISPIQDDEIERFFKEAREDKRDLNLHKITDKEATYGSANLVIIATATIMMMWTISLIHPLLRIQ